MNSEKNSANWEVYVCKACGVFYREEEGDPDSGIPAGTKFTDIPDDWECPVCGVTKYDFVLYEPIQSKQTRSVASSSIVKKKCGASPLRYEDVVIVGAGKAGWQIAENLRKLDENQTITLITACSGDLYDKPLISVSISKKIASDSFIKESGMTAAHRLKIHLFTKTYATGLSPESKIIRTTKGSFRYKNLVIATGSTPIELKNTSFRDCWHVNNLESYLGFRKLIDHSSSKIAIIGAGLIGCELANDLALAGHQIYLIDNSKLPLGNLLPEVISNQLLAAWKKLPITFLGNQSLENIEIGHDFKKLYLSNSESVNVNHIVLAAGLQSKKDFLVSTKLEWNNGLAVNPLTLQSSDPYIYGLGDCISINGTTSRFIEPIMRQAEVIARQICGDKNSVYSQSSIPIRIKTSSLPIQIDGKINKDGFWIKEEKPELFPSKKVLFTQFLNNQIQATIRLG